MKKIKKQNIAFFTQSDDFVEHITFLRKKGINVLSIDESSELAEVSFVIIDLKYEDDKAYEILNRINNNPKLSHMNVFVVVRTRNEMNKLSILQNIRIVDYLSASITPEEFLDKISLALDFENQPYKRVDRKLALRTNAEMTHISESGALVQSTILFNSNRIIEVESKLLEKALLRSDPIYNISKTIIGANGVFLSEVDFLNLDDKDRLTLRKLIHGWRVK